MRKALRSIWKTEGKREVSNPSNLKATFTLHYGKLAIGKLKLENRKWTFRYTREFKAQNEIKPITEFPRTDKVYESEELFPFFVHRIPSLSQPKIRATIEREKIEANEAALLRRFGEHSISNPFRLQAVTAA
ncbi:MAG: HipA N-terminal domain-containing protein [Bacteroidota bacterium]